MIRVVENKNFSLRDVKQTSFISSWDPKEVADFHETIGNKETPLVKLPGLAKRLGIGSLLLKDESHRFGLNAFKALGASYAMYRQIEKKPQIKAFCTATDGNHGRASVEPHSANCLFESIKTGNRVSVKNDETTTMAGLNCGSVSTLAWNILKNGLVGSISISDKLSEEAMITLASPVSGDPVIISGESGASGLGALIGLCKTREFNKFKEKICLNKTSSVLVINTEGDTDRSNYKRVVTDNIENNF